jgi:phosphatidylglycerol:prolipoprotein diacylglycerol transferase
MVRIPLPGGEDLPVHSYGLMIVLGFFLLIWVSSREARRRGLPDFVYDLGLVMLLCGLLGGRIFYYALNWQEQYRNESLLEFFKIWKGGLVFYGGALGGLLGGLVYLWRKRLPLADCLDVAAVGAPIGMAFGRLGCFLNGCCFGGPSGPDYVFGVVFPRGSPAWESQLAAGWLSSRASPALAVHPVQLYQAVHDLLLFGLLYAYLRRPEAIRGAGMPLLIFLYGVGRFQLEFLRGDQIPTATTGLTVGQNVSIGLVVLSGAALGALLRRASREPVARAAGDSP